MVDASGIRAGQAFVELFADDKRLVQGLNAASKRLKAWGQGVTAMGQKFLAAGAAVGSAAGAAGKLFSDVGDSLQKMSQRTGLSVETLSELAFAADSSGTSLETIEAAVRTMQKNLAGGAAATRETLSQLGLSLESLQGLNPEQQFKTLADAIANIQDPGQKAALAMALFGKSGTQLLPLFAEGAAGIEAMQKQARELGLTMSSEDANAAAALNDALGALMASLKRIVTLIGAAVAPALQRVAKWLTLLTTHVVDFLNQNRELVATFFKIAVAVAAAGAALIVTGQLIAGVGAALGAMATIITGIGTALGMLSSLFAAVLTPAGALITIVAALAGYASYVSGAWGPVLTWLAETFNWVAGIAVQAWRGIADALAAGDLQLAAEIALEGLKIVWYEALAWIKQKWVDLKTKLINIWYDLIYGLAQMLLTGVSRIQTIWTNLQSNFRRLWVNTTKFVGDTWDKLYYWLARSFTKLTHLFSSAAEKAAALEALDKEQAERAEERAKKADEDLAQIEREQNEKNAEIDKGLMDSLNALDEDRKRATEGLFEDEQQEIDDLRKKAKEAQKHFDDLTQRAAEQIPERKLPEAPRLPRLEEEYEMPTLKEAEKRATFGTVSGTFSGFAVLAQSGGPVADTARNTAKMTRQLSQLNQLLDRNLRFN